MLKIVFDNLLAPAHCWGTMTQINYYNVWRAAEAVKRRAVNLLRRRLETEQSAVVAVADAEHAAASLIQTAQQRAAAAQQDAKAAWESWERARDACSLAEQDWKSQNENN